MLVNALLTLAGFVSYPVMAEATVPVPRNLVIISCRVNYTGETNEQTHWVGMEWLFKDAEMQCKREVVELQDAAEENGAPPIDHDLSDNFQCQQAAMTYTPEYNKAHHGWAVYMVGCPNPIYNGDGKVIGYKMPECPSSVKCNFDPSFI